MVYLASHLVPRVPLGVAPQTNKKTTPPKKKTTQNPKTKTLKFQAMIYGVNCPRSRKQISNLFFLLQ